MSTRFSNRIIFVNRFFHPDHSATSQLLADLAFGLAQRGYRVTVVTSRATSDGSTNRLPKYEVVEGVEVRRASVTRLGRHHLLGRAIDYASFYASCLITLVKAIDRGSVVVAKTDPPGIGIAVGWLARIRKARFVNWFQDVFPEIATQLKFGRGPLWGIFSRCLTVLRDRSVQSADDNVVIGETMKRRLIHSSGVNIRTTVISNWSDGAQIIPVEPGLNRLRTKYGLHETFVVGYSGNLGRAHDASTIMEALEILGDAKNSNLQLAQQRIVWLFIGGGVGYLRVKNEVHKRKWKNVMFLPYQSRSALSESLSLPDLHLVSLHAELTGLAVPSKYYGIAAAGRPAIFIGSEHCEIAQLIRLSDGGDVVQPGNGLMLVEAVRKFAQNPGRTKMLGENARRSFEAQFDRRHALEAWTNMLEKITADENARSSRNLRE